MIHIRVSPEPIDIAAEQARIEHNAGQGGAVATFTGLVRADDGVEELTLEHYPGATEAALTRLAEEACHRWSLTRASASSSSAPPHRIARRRWRHAPS